MATCPTCKKFYWQEPHTCWPQWLCRTEDCSFEDYDPIYAPDAEEAAKVFAKRYDQDGDYFIVRGNDMDVLVKSVGDDDTKIERFSIWAEAVPTYYARNIT